MDDFIDLVRRYQRYDPQTGRFDVDRTAEQYADLLGPGVHPSQLSRFYNGKLERPWAIINAFLRTFPHASDAVARALRAEEAEHVPA